MAGRLARSGRALSAGTLTLLLTVGLAACGSSSKSTSSAQAAVTSSTTSATSSSSTATAKKKPAAKKKTTTKHSTTTTKSTTTTSTKSKTSTTHSTTTTSTTTTHSTTTPAFVGPMKATLVGENHNPVIGTLWAYTVTATDANGKPLSGTIETEFAYGGAVVGRETPFKHTLSNGKIVNKITFPKKAEGVTGLDLQVIVQTSLGTKTLDWTVNPVVKKK